MISRRGFLEAMYGAGGALTLSALLPGAMAEAFAAPRTIHQPRRGRVTSGGKVS